MTKDDMLSVYRRVIASPRDEPVWWWYLGTTFVDLGDDYPIPVSHPETIMIYDVETVSNDVFRVTWREVGYFRDPVTGDVASSWPNPRTGEDVQAPSRFEEGPATYTFTQTSDGVCAELSQAHAYVHGIDIAVSETDTCVHITQTERKTRSFPDQDGVIRDPEEGSASAAVTTLSFTAPQGELRNESADFVPAFGTYEFRLQTVPGWMGFGAVAGTTVVHGVIAKGRPGEVINKTTWDRLNALYPEFF